MTVGFVGLLTTISVFVGAYLGLNYAIPEKVLSSILAFAAGSLIAALAIELSFEGAEALVKHGFGIRASWFNMAMGFGVGAALYYTASVFLESKGAPIRLPHMLFNAKNSRIAADEKIVPLSRSPLFSHRGAAGLETIVDTAFLRSCDSGEAVFQPGEPGDALYVIADGEVLLTDPNGHVIATLSQGEAFGEMALLGSRLRNATAKALRETKLLVIDAQSFQRLLELDSTFRTKVHDMARERSLANLKEAHLDSSTWASAYRTSLAHKAEPKHDESVAAGRGVGLAIIFGNILDTIPGCLVIGAKFAGFESMSATLMVGMFLGGIPESAASATLLRRAGFSSAKIYGMWSIVIIAGIISAMLGNAFISDTDSVFAVIMQAVAAGAILAMVSHAMIPEAFHKGGSASVLPVVLGFLFALYLALEEANLKPPDQTSIGRSKLRNGTSEIMHSHAPLEPESRLMVVPPQGQTPFPPCPASTHLCSIAA